MNAENRVIVQILNTSDQLRDEMTILETIYHKEAGGASTVRQRDLAAAVGLSLGMINIILKRLARKGWLSIRKVNNRNIQYVVTPRGMEKITRRSIQFMRRTIDSIVGYRDIISRFLDVIAGEGYTSVVMVGRSDLDFMVEFLCQKKLLGFSRSDRELPTRKTWNLFGEHAAPSPAGMQWSAGKSSLSMMLEAGRTT
jgi:DNA-binding MarR family transcriptional regulator